MADHGETDHDEAGPDEAGSGADPTRFGSLDELYEAMREDAGAPREHYSPKFVPGEGPAGAPVMLVGEQPGDEEDKAGLPFVGPAGRLLDRALDEAGLDRRRLFLTNAVKRFKFVQRGKRRLHQTPTSGEIAHYRWWLMQEVMLVAPQVVVSLGASALRALTGKAQTISRVRGQTMPLSQERLLLPTVHPSFLLRLRDESGRKIEYAKFVSDLAKAAELGAQ